MSTSPFKAFPNHTGDGYHLSYDGSTFICYGDQAELKIFATRLNEAWEDAINATKEMRNARAAKAFEAECDQWGSN